MKMYKICFLMCALHSIETNTIIESTREQLIEIAKTKPSANVIHQNILKNACNVLIKYFNLDQKALFQNIKNFNDFKQAVMYYITNPDLLNIILFDPLHNEDIFIHFVENLEKTFAIIAPQIINNYRLPEQKKSLFKKIKTSIWMSEKEKEEEAKEVKSKETILKSLYAFLYRYIQELKLIYQDLGVSECLQKISDKGCGKSTLIQLIAESLVCSDIDLAEKNIHIHQKTINTYKNEADTLEEILKLTTQYKNTTQKLDELLSESGSLNAFLKTYQTILDKKGIGPKITKFFHLTLGNIFNANVLGLTAAPFILYAIAKNRPHGSEIIPSSTTGYFEKHLRKLAIASNINDSKDHSSIKSEDIKNEENFEYLNENSEKLTVQNEKTQDALSDMFTDQLFDFKEERTDKDGYTYDVYTKNDEKDKNNNFNNISLLSVIKSFISTKVINPAHSNANKLLNESISIEKSLYEKNNKQRFENLLFALKNNLKGNLSEDIKNDLNNTIPALSKKLQNIESRYKATKWNEHDTHNELRYEKSFLEKEIYKVLDTIINNYCNEKEELSEKAFKEKLEKDFLAKKESDFKKIVENEKKKSWKLLGMGALLNQPYTFIALGGTLLAIGSFFILKKAFNISSYIRKIHSLLNEQYEITQKLLQLCEVQEELFEYKVLKNKSFEEQLAKECHIKGKHRFVNYLYYNINPYAFTEYIKHLTSKPFHIKYMDRFVYMCDAAASKALLIQESHNQKYKYSIPNIEFNAKTPFIRVKNTFYPKLGSLGVQNSMVFSKNIFLTAPYAAGKTVFLANIIALLYMGNVGIVPAEKASYSYFSNIMTHIAPPYEIGSGVSKHMAERLTFEATQRMLTSNTGFTFYIADELFASTVPAMAAAIIKNELPKILDNPNVMSLITTHFPEIIELVDIPDYQISINPEGIKNALMYILIDKNKDGSFTKRYKVNYDFFNSDPENWWFKDPESAKRYGLVEGKKDTQKISNMAF